MTTSQTTTYELNGTEIQDWAEHGGCDQAGVEYAATNLTDTRPGDVLTAIVSETHEGRSVEVARYSTTIQ